MTCSCGLDKEYGHESVEVHLTPGIIETVEELDPLYGECFSEKLAFVARRGLGR